MRETAVDAPALPPVLAAQGIAKSYGATHALRGVDMAFQGGEVHAIVGENGAGKSTLTHILTGAVRADVGHIMVDGQRVPLSGPLEAQRLSIRMVHQHDTLVPNLSVAENILLGQWPRRQTLRWIDWGAMHRRAAAVLGELGYPGLPLHRLAGSLPASQRQIVEIAKAVSVQPRVLILDEPTAALAQEDISRLFAFVRRLRDRGTAIVYISHHLDEIFELADRVTVLRDGSVTGSVPVAQTDKQGLIRLMVGRSINDLHPVRTRPAPRPALRVEGLMRVGHFEPVTFEVGVGEIVGMYGLIGSGRTEIARCLYGADSASGGSVTWEGEPLALRSPREALRAGIALLTEDRLGDGLVRGMSVRDNATLACLPRLTRLGVLRRAEQGAWVQEQVRRLDVRPPDIERDVATLSGGNQQKVVLAKWLLTQARLLILDEPTRGVDIAAKRDIYDTIGGLADAGLAVLLISSDLPEVLGMSDRVLVMREGRLAGCFDRAQASEERLLACASGVAH